MLTIYSHNTSMPPIVLTAISNYPKHIPRTDWSLFMAFNKAHLTQNKKKTHYDIITQPVVSFFQKHVILLGYLFIDILESINTF